MNGLDEAVSAWRLDDDWLDVRGDHRDEHQVCDLDVRHDDGDDGAEVMDDCGYSWSAHEELDDNNNGYTLRPRNDKTEYRQCRQRYTRLSNHNIR